MIKFFFGALSSLLIVLFFAGGGKASSPDNKGPKIALANVKKVFSHSREVKKAERWLKKKNRALEKKILKYKVDLRNLQKKLEVLNKESEVYKEIHWKLEEKVLELKNFVLLQTKRLRKEYGAKLKVGLARIRRKIKAYLRKHGYVLFFNISASQTSEFEESIFYYHPKIDLTKELIGLFQ